MVFLLWDQVADVVRAWSRRRGAQRALHVLLMLGAVAQAHELDLMHMTGLGSGAVRRALADLERDGYVHGRDVFPEDLAEPVRRLYWSTAEGKAAAMRKAAALRDGDR